MKNFDGQEMEVRETNRGKFQALPVPHTAGDMSRAPVFDTRDEAETYIARPIPEWLANERAKAQASEPYVNAYTAVLSHPDLREMRRRIQELYGEAAERSRLADATQRAAIRGAGQISVMGRDIGQVRQSVADGQGDEADEAWTAYEKARGEYEIAVQAAMREAGIPVGMFRSAITTLKCTRCGHTWIRRQETPPKQCPKCRSPYWDRPKKALAGQKEE